MRIFDTIRTLFCLPGPRSSACENYFHFYVRNNDLHHVREICEGVEDWTKLPYSGISPLFDAVVNNHMEVAEYLLRNGATEEKDLRVYVPTIKMLRLVQRYHG